MTCTAHHSSKLVVICVVLLLFVLFYVLFVFVLFYVLFVCKCVLYYCHRVLTQLQLTNISYHIISNVNIVLIKTRADGRGMWNLWGRRKMHTGLWWGNSKERGHWECVSVDGRILMTFKKYAGRT